MAATRLSDGQKRELVERFRGGEGAQALARAYGCSAATVTRAVKAALAPQEYEALRSPSGRRSAEGAAAEPAPQPIAAAGAASGRQARENLENPENEDDDDPATLAIDDADDFGDDEDDDLLEEDADGEDGLEGEDDPSVFVAITPLLHLDDHAAAEPVPLTTAQLPVSAYMLVDKTVELQARPLSEFPELGRLAPEELERQALVVFANPRQARRQCGRSQRVIKVPDLRVLELTAPYLLAQGISRVVMEGSLYSLPGS